MPSSRPRSISPIKARDGASKRLSSDASIPATSRRSLHLKTNSGLRQAAERWLAELVGLELDELGEDAFLSPRDLLDLSTYAEDGEERGEWQGLRVKDLISARLRCQLC